MNKWRTIDSAPKDGTFILMVDAGDVDPPVVGYFGSPGVYAPAYYGSDAWRVVWDQARFGRTTHWMPLPAAPGKEKP